MAIIAIKYQYIEPNVGLVNVPDSLLVKLGKINKSEKLQHAVVSNFDY